jgi:hypothetical protein
MQEYWQEEEGKDGWLIINKFPLFIAESKIEKE